MWLLTRILTHTLSHSLTLEVEIVRKISAFDAMYGSIGMQKYS